MYPNKNEMFLVKMKYKRGALLSYICKSFRNICCFHEIFLMNRYIIYKNRFFSGLLNYWQKHCIIWLDF